MYLLGIQFHHILQNVFIEFIIFQVVQPPILFKTNNLGQQVEH